jgi:hypothetical protein
VEVVVSSAGASDSAGRRDGPDATSRCVYGRGNFTTPWRSPSGDRAGRQSIARRWGTGASSRRARGTGTPCVAHSTLVSFRRGQGALPHLAHLVAPQHALSPSSCERRTRPAQTTRLVPGRRR